MKKYIKTQFWKSILKTVNRNKRNPRNTRRKTKLGSRKKGYHKLDMGIGYEQLDIKNWISKNSSKKYKNESRRNDKKQKIKWRF